MENCYFLIPEMRKLVAMPQMRLIQMHPTGNKLANHTNLELNS